MKNITIEMTRTAYEFYKTNWNNKGFCKEALIKYINNTGGYMGRVVDIAITD